MVYLCASLSLIPAVFVFRKYVLVGTLIMHDSYFAKVTGGDKFYFGKTLLTVAASFYPEIIIGHWLKPRVAPEKRHIYPYNLSKWLFLCLLVFVNDLIHAIMTAVSPASFAYLT